MRSMAARLVATAGAAGLVLVVGLATAAHAADQGRISVLVNEITLSPLQSPSTTANLDITLFNAENPVITIDPTLLRDRATLDAPQGCARAASGNLTCHLPSQAGLVELKLPLVIHATANTVTPDSLYFEIRSTIDNGDPWNTYGHVTVSNAVGLLAVPAYTPLASNRPPADPGAHLTMDAGVSNAGTVAAHGFRLTVTSDNGLLPDTYDNCVYGSVKTYQHEFSCDLPDAVLRPGDPPLMVHDETGKQLGFTVAPYATVSSVAEFQFESLGSAPAVPSQLTAQPHSGHLLSLSPGPRIPTDRPQGQPDNLGVTNWGSSKTHRDVSAAGATARAKVGDTVDVFIGFQNHGPAVIAGRGALDPATQSVPFTFSFVPPANSDVVAVPNACDSVIGNQSIVPGGLHGTYYRCRYADFVPVGRLATIKVTLKITAATGTAGSVFFNGTPLRSTDHYVDDNAANDTAQVVVGPDVSPPGSTGVTPVSLPVTGAPLALIAIVGVVIVVAGVGLLLLGRRRGRT
jgi:hypothetical protein